MAVGALSHTSSDGSSSRLHPFTHPVTLSLSLSLSLSLTHTHTRAVRAVVVLPYTYTHTYAFSSSQSLLLEKKQDLIFYYDFSTTDMNSSIDDAEEETAGPSSTDPPVPNTFRSPDASTSVFLVALQSPIRRLSHRR